MSLHKITNHELDIDDIRNRQMVEYAEQIREQMRAEFLGALKDEGPEEPILREFRCEIDGTFFCASRDLPTTVRDLLDGVRLHHKESVLMLALLNVLKHSKCPEVEAFRELAAEIYAAQAEDIAESEFEDD